jgi:hypothetical protein
MDFPKIETCFVCEGVRAELNNKHILLGFFGVAPHVRVWLQDFTRPATLCFVFCGGTGPGGTYNIGLRLTDSQGTVVTNTNTAADIKNGTLGPGRSVTNIFMGFNGMLGRPGKYRVELLIDGVSHYSTTVDLEPVPAPTPASSSVH